MRRSERNTGEAAPKPGRPRSVRSEQAILKATMEILVERGYHGFTMDEIVTRASVSKATIYRHWPSKELLAVAAVDRLPKLSPADKGSIEEDLLAIVVELADFVQNTTLGAVWPTLVGERSRNPELKAALDKATDRRRNPARLALRRAVERGDLPGDLDLELALDMVMGPVMLRLMFENADVDAGAFREIVRWALRGMGGRSSTDPRAPLSGSARQDVI